ncbi:glycine radical enzyme, YjjI family [Citrobacter amalonaticus]|nr:glycine radical enzyme, YjjI family [Citrobacter amalonaticus]
MQEGLIDPQRFVPMFGMYGLAEAVNLLCEKAGMNARYGKDETANDLGYRISAQLADFVENTPVKYGWQQRAMLHAQSGISSDIGTTPGARLPYGDEPDPITHLQTVAPHHSHYQSGISDILTLDETIKRNPQALVQLCLGAFKAGNARVYRQRQRQRSGPRYRVHGAPVGSGKIPRRRIADQYHLAGGRGRTQYAYSGTPTSCRQS